MVTKVGHENFVMQCRRCIGLGQKKDPFSPSSNKCQTCKQVGASCVAFSTKKTSKQEETLRKENEGTDPITEVSPGLINNASNVLFRCTRCQRGWHYEHLPRPKKMFKNLEDPNDIRDACLEEYGAQWQCRDCLDHTEKPSGLVAWRPLDKDLQSSDNLTLYGFAEDDKEYLVRWEDQSYFQCTWMPGSWVYGVVATMSRNAFARREDGANEKPKWTDEEAIPEEFLRMEIVFDVEYDARFVPKSEESDKAQISMVDLVLVKFQGLGYEDVVWEAPPTPDEPQRWSCFVSAYNEFVVGRYFKQSPASDMKKRLDKFHSSNFAKAVKVKQQPEALAGGTLMTYQKDGMNWMLENFHKKKNVILADEMGLGKTIQVIALLAYLVKTSPKVWPFLIVTPNSTCPNWRREIKKWIPSLRVVTYYGGAKALDMARNFELYPEGSSELRAHVVVTSYEAPVQDTNFFRKIKWAGMIVDEGQRLKNDENLLYSALKSLKTPWQCLLTGTPLQNNIRELFNLLAFLDDSINAAQLEAKYEGQMTTVAGAEIQTMIRPFYLRRTKLHVLKDLPSLTQVILPVSMSIVQKKLYKSILAKNPNLIKSIFGQRNSELRFNERSNLNNILIQLRKCLCHPFIYSAAIEERSVGEEALHRNLIDASSKFQLLEIMLPKLQARGHRVLLFSQFLLQLDLIEDFLKGLGLPFRRLDGTMDALQKQKRIDEFNAPDSEIFAFLLSTRSGGVGINLATADTVIIMDPDFNPQQDIQAISRAHRIGQKNNVLVFQLMTKDTAEEKIIQIGRKKIALGALIETDGVEDEEEIDLESILKHGTKALFEDDNQNDIRYDSHSVDKLLDRSQVEATKTTEERQQSQFALARVWAHDKEALGAELEDAENGDETPNLSIWEGILKQREADAAAEAAKNMQDFGRGKRARHMVNYERPNMDVDDDATNSQHTRRRTGRSGSISDGEFAAATIESEVEEHDSDSHSIDPRELSTGKHTKEANSNQFQPGKAIPSSQQPGIKTGDKSQSSKQNKAQHKSSAHTPLPGNDQVSQNDPYRDQFGGARNTQLQRVPISQPQSLPPYQPRSQDARLDNTRTPFYSSTIISSNQPNPYLPQHQYGSFAQASNQLPQSAAANMKQLCPLCGFDHSGSNVCPMFSSETKCRLILDALELNQSLDPSKRWRQKVAVQYVTQQLEKLNVAAQETRSATIRSEMV
ncbi:P-loop containing nucleoside triphosphate hydrolase protein [Amylocarpus encephaloides]|uniref:P-loop containing nucleoside triphosphate hydrolase protein n=1 Tax=Amylocarpus encephaloides TaxID=45428 RepID=A0A9P7YR12_9HELO|nr:P-loop containing nucleoside triphosphate hydrolase protein [Amylocarpus encephaloides]